MHPPEQISAIAKEAFIYGYPIVDNHHVIHQYVLDKHSAEYKAPFNQAGQIETLLRRRTKPLYP